MKPVPEKALSPMEVTELRSDMVVRALQFQKALAPMVPQVDPKTTSSSEEQP